MMAVEAVKEKFYCFLGIVHPTYYQSRGWGPWLGNTAYIYQSGGQINIFQDSHFWDCISYLIEQGNHDVPSDMKKSTAQFGALCESRCPPWLFVPSLSQLLANDPSIISDTQSADKWRDLDEIKDNCNISLIDSPPPISARTLSRDQKKYKTGWIFPVNYQGRHQISRTINKYLAVRVAPCWHPLSH